MMDTLPSNVASDPSLPSASLALAIGSHTLEFEFASALCGPASNPSGLDIWAVRVAASAPSAGRAETFIYKTGTLARDRGPDPLGILKGLASDVTLALQLPADPDEAAAFLFLEGYITWPHEAPAMVQALRAVQAALANVLIGTGITPAEFVIYIDAMPYTPRLTLPMPQYRADFID
jgi:hypothetical protein